jgi:hypothetical protein
MCGWVRAWKKGGSVRLCTTLPAKGKASCAAACIGFEATLRIPLLACMLCLQTLAAKHYAEHDGKPFFEKVGAPSGPEDLQQL